MNKVLLEISNCSECPNHYVAGIITADSFEHEVGLYCMKTRDTEDSWERHTRDGYLPYRLVASDEWNVRKISKIPDWCPYVAQQYRKILDYIMNDPEYLEKMHEVYERRMDDWRDGSDNGVRHAVRVANYADQFLSQCSELYFWKSNCYVSEKDAWLTKIAALLHDVAIGEDDHGKIGEDYARDYLNGMVGLSVVDVEMIAKAISEHSHGERLETMVDAALCLADKMDVSELRVRKDVSEMDLTPMLREMQKIERVEYAILAEGREPYGAELRYETAEDFKVTKLREWPECVTVPRMITKEFLKLRSFSFIVNGERIDIRRLTKKYKYQ